MGHMETILVERTQELTQEQGRTLLAARVSDRLGISLETFLERYDRGEYVESEDRDIIYFEMLLPFAR